MNDEIAPPQIVGGKFKGVSDQQVCKWQKQLHFWSMDHNSSAETSKLNQHPKEFLPMPYQTNTRKIQEDTHFVSTTSWVYK